MNSIDGILRTVILLGAIQGIITGFLLFYSSSNRQSNRILAILIWLMSLAGLNLYVEYTGWFYSSTTIAVIHALVPMVIIMPLGPLIYFYIQSSIDPDFRIKKKQRFHFLPVIIDLVPQLTAVIFIVGVYAGQVKPNQAPWSIFIDTYNIYADIPRWISLMIYIWLSGKYLAQRSINNNTANLQQNRRIKWLQLFVRAFTVFQLIWLIYLIPYVTPRYNQWILSTFDWYPVYIPAAILIYWLGIKGYIVGITVLPAGKKKRSEAIPSEKAIEQLINELTKAMEEDRLYLNPTLSINELSQHINTAPKVVSLILNQHIGMSFTDYVNKFRIEEFKRKLLQEDWERLTITGLAFECGFNSKASFQRIFKQQTGMSPSEFRKSVSQTP